LKEVPVTVVFVPTIVDLTMLDDDDNDDVDTLKVPIIDESNPDGKGSSLPEDPQPKETFVATSTTEKVTTQPELGSQPPKEEKTQEGEGGGESEDQSSEDTTSEKEENEKDKDQEQQLGGA
jgi:hypothetical protein